MRLWDAALDFGVLHTRGLQLFSKVLSHHGKVNHPCPLCGIACMHSKEEKCCCDYRFVILDA